MKKNIQIYIIIIVLLQSTFSFAQTSFHNFGNIQIHNEGEIGFHTDFINDGTFDNNLGFAGFYNDNGLITVSGSQRAIFYDLEVDVEDNLYLYSSLGLTNDMFYTKGRIITPRNNISISLDYINHNIYVDEGDSEHTDGYASFTGSDEFIFPIGDDLRLRPMIIPDQSSESYFKGAFFYEDPNSPTTFPNPFNTSNKQLFLQNINNYEFWDLDGDTETKITLTWDTESNINDVANNIDLLRVVGWSENNNKWEDLGMLETTGDLSVGSITSNSFIPNNYTVITIGSQYEGENVGLSYGISPNGDGINDVLVFEGLNNFAENTLEIYNRWGNLVYKANNYNNDWGGISNGKLVYLNNEKIPAGAYLFVLKIKDTNYNSELFGWVQVTY